LEEVILRLIYFLPYQYHGHGGCGCGRGFGVCNYVLSDFGLEVEKVYPKF
jgi:hypothetical protein